MCDKNDSITYLSAAPRAAQSRNWHRRFDVRWPPSCSTTLGAIAGHSPSCIRESPAGVPCLLNTRIRHILQEEKRPCRIWVVSSSWAASSPETCWHRTWSSRRMWSMCDIFGGAAARPLPPCCFVPPTRSPALYTSDVNGCCHDGSLPTACNADLGCWASGTESTSFSAMHAFAGWPSPDSTSATMGQPSAAPMRAAAATCCPDCSSPTTSKPLHVDPLRSLLCLKRGSSVNCSQIAICHDD